MKYFSFILLLAAVLVRAPQARAQHCPFDGFYTVVVHPAKPLPASYKLSLEVIASPELDSCAYSSDFKSMPFRAKPDSFLRDRSDYTQRRFRDLQKQDYDFTKGNYMAMMSSGQRDCMIPVPGKSEYRFIPRRFRVVISDGNRMVKSIEIPAGNVWHLCGTAGSWKRIQPLEISW